MKLDFVKQHGCGNDYIYVNGFVYDIENPSETAKTLSDRHFGIGADGLIIVCPSAVCDAKMRMFNADGSEGKMCGNGIRCAAKFAYDSGICRKNIMRIETLSGVKTVRLEFSGGEVVGATVDMGAAVFAAEQIPAAAAGEIVARKVALAGREREITCVSMGNPHCVIFVPADFDLWGFDIEKEGAPIERDAFFPEGVNVEFVRQIDKAHLQMRVWERGSGETFACGTGACASAAAAVRLGLCPKDTDISVELRGGTLVINVAEDGVSLQGNAVMVFSGSVEI